MKIEFLATEIGYVGNTVLGPLDFSVNASEIVAVVGPSGCGKTTLLKAISGEVPIRSGAIQIDGANRNRAWLVEHLARTIQSFPLLHWLTVEENLMMAAKMKKGDPSRISTVLQEFSACHLRSRYPRTLSGGERCRASLAQAAIFKPKVLLLDEPFTGLDLHVKEDIAQHLFSFAQNYGTSIIFVTHELYDACEYAQRVVVLTGNKPALIKKIVNPSDEDAVQQIRRAIKGE